jgi:hypothetical protein
LEYIKHLQRKCFFIIRFKKEYDTALFWTYEHDVCYNLYNFSFLKHSVIMGKQFIKNLSIITKKFDFYNLNLMLYKILCENPSLFCIEELFIYHNETVQKYLFFFNDERYLM